MVINISVYVYRVELIRVYSISQKSATFPGFTSCWTTLYRRGTLEIFVEVQFYAICIVLFPLVNVLR